MPGFQSTRCSRVHVASEPGRGPVGEMAQSSQLTEDSWEYATRRGPCPRFPSQDIESRPLTLSALLPETWSPGVRPVMAVQAASGECGGHLPGSGRGVGRGRPVPLRRAGAGQEA